MSFGKIYYSPRIPLDGKIFIYLITICLVLLTIDWLINMSNISTEKEKLDKEEEGTHVYNTIQNNIHYYSLLKSINAIGVSVQIIALLVITCYFFGIK